MSSRRYPALTVLNWLLWLRRSLPTFAPLADRNGIILESEGDGVMIGSDTLIYRMLFNLTENSIRYNRPNGTVRIMITDEKNRLVIRVTDTGCGIPEKYRESIFQPFFRVDKSRSREYGGVGLGLSLLVWEIVALHGGEVLIEESSEKGDDCSGEAPDRHENKVTGKVKMQAQLLILTVFCDNFQAFLR